MNEIETGIVLKETDVKDNDRIIQVYTEHYGIISLYGRGLKKITSRNSFACQLFDLSEFSFDYNPQKDLQLLKSAVLKKEYLNVKGDYDRLVLGSMVLEIISLVNDDGLYELLHETLEHLDSHDEPYLIFNIFVVQILNHLGIAPETDRCVVCGDSNNIETISIADGGFLCHGCNSVTRLKPMDVAFLKRFRIISKASYEVLDKIINMGLNDHELTDLLVEFLVTHSGLNLRSWRSFRSLYE